MSEARFSLFVFGLYLVFRASAGFMLFPRFLPGLLGLSAGHDVWIRMVGMLASIIGGYDIMAARAGLDRVALWTVTGRSYAETSMLLLLAPGKIVPPLLLFAGIDAAALTWTLVALRRTA